MKRTAKIIIRNDEINAKVKHDNYFSTINGDPVGAVNGVIEMIKDDHKNIKNFKIITK